MSNRVYQWLDRWLAIVMPLDCVVCGASAQTNQDLCPACLEDLPRLHQVCSRCGMALSVASSGPCGQCLKQPPEFDAVWAPFAYEFPLDQLIQQFKFSDQLVFGRLLARLMLQTGSPQLPEVLIPVPLHPARLRQRGFNQATELALHLGRQLAVPVAASVLARSRDTPSQSGLDASQRRANLKQAFAMAGELAWGHVALVDDVMTTGSTARCCARVLKAAGVRRVDVWVCARA